MILLGSELIESWKPVLLLFAGILLFSSFKLLTGGKEDGEDEDLSDNGVVKLCRSGALPSFPALFLYAWFLQRNFGIVERIQFYDVAYASILLWRIRMCAAGKTHPAVLHYKGATSAGWLHQLVTA